MWGVLSRWGPVAIIMAGIYLGSEQPAVHRAPHMIEFFIAKISHLLEFAALGAALVRATTPAGEPAPVRAVAQGVAVSSLYAVSDEYHQRFTPGRTASVRDVVIDLLGALGGGVGYMVLAFGGRKSDPRAAPLCGSPPAGARHAQAQHPRVTQPDRTSWDEATQ